MNSALVYLTSSFGAFIASSGALLSSNGRAGLVLLLSGSTALAIHVKMHYDRLYDKEVYSELIQSFNVHPLILCTTGQSAALLTYAYYYKTLFKGNRTAKIVGNVGIGLITTIMLARGIKIAQTGKLDSALADL